MYRDPIFRGVVYEKWMNRGSHSVTERKKATPDIFTIPFGLMKKKLHSVRMSFWSIEPIPANTNPNPCDSSFNIDAYVRTLYSSYEAASVEYAVQKLKRT